jgi:hypothetical protein
VITSPLSERRDYGAEEQVDEPDLDENQDLAPGIAWHLEEDGQWQPLQIPKDVLDTAIFSGYLTIQGYRASVFETPDGDQWAQKTDLSKLSSIAGRIAGIL